MSYFPHTLILKESYQLTFNESNSSYESIPSDVVLVESNEKQIGGQWYEFPFPVKVAKTTLLIFIETLIGGDVQSPIASSVEMDVSPGIYRGQFALQSDSVLMLHFGDYEPFSVQLYSNNVI